MLAAGKLSAFGGGSGVSMPVAAVKLFGAGTAERYTNVYWMALALAVVAFAATWFLMRSRIGVGLTAMRDDEEGAGSIGVNLRFARILCFLFAAPFLGIAGAIITLQKLRVAPPASFSILDWTVYVIFIVVIGGIGYLEGPIVGAVVFFALQQFLADSGTWYLILLGLIAMASAIWMRQGLWGAVIDRTGIRLFPVGYHLRDRPRKDP